MANGGGAEGHFRRSPLVGALGNEGSDRIVAHPWNSIELLPDMH